MHASKFDYYSNRVYIVQYVRVSSFFDWKLFRKKKSYLFAIKFYSVWHKDKDLLETLKYQYENTTTF